MKNKTRLFNTLIIITLFLSACNLPSSDSEDVASTAAAQTVEALLSATPLSGAATPTFTPLPGLPATSTPIPSPILTNTPPATATSNCNVAQFITDVTIPDGTVMTPGNTFTKKWRFRNIGSCTWTGFSLVFDSGDALGGPATKAISTVNPGQEVDLEVNLTAPATVGNYRGYWRITTNASVPVPIVSGYQGKSFYVDIKVQNPATATNTSAPAFAVTSVTYNISGTCGNFHVSANITTNSAGTVKFYWQANGVDDFEGTYGSTLIFASAQTLTTPIIDWSISAVGSHYLRVYIEDPNHQFIGQSSNMVCP
jgi:hypothetical protein